MRHYQFAATSLALLRDGIDRGLHRRGKDLDGAMAEERRLLEAVDAYRRVFVGRDPLTPRAWWSGGIYQIQFPDGVVRTVPAPPLPVVPVPFATSGVGAAHLTGVGNAPPGPGVQGPPGPAVQR
jgi:hypothetical protein